MRRRLIVAACFVLALIAGATLYRNLSSPPDKSSNQNGDSTQQSSSVPVFPTKEPERYQATRTLTYTESVTNTETPVNETRTTSVLIVRDGEQRREEHGAGVLGSIVYLENSQGRFVLLPKSKLYADAGAAADSGSVPMESETGVSTDMLLNESPAPSRYEKLGAETVNGRAATKYRLTSSADQSSRRQTFVWIDESLGMPIKSETSYTDSDRSTKVLMELKDITTEVDAGLFALPADYRKVSASVIFGLLSESANRTPPEAKQK